MDADADNITRLKLRPVDWRKSFVTSRGSPKERGVAAAIT